MPPPGVADRRSRLQRLQESKDLALLVVIVTVMAGHPPPEFVYFSIVTLTGLGYFDGRRDLVGRIR